jgi:hypothetical protein|tara:strand:+ start:1775 stop:1960 length:186 start_codon:yes stop_codon:yes gene_type:complete
MGLAETIKKVKEISKKLQDRNISDREVIHYTQELHRLIDNLEVPQLIGQEDDNIFRNILHN